MVLSRSPQYLLVDCYVVGWQQHSGIRVSRVRVSSTASSVYSSQRGSSPFHRSIQTALDWIKLSYLHYSWCTPSVQSSSQQLPMNCRKYAKKSELQNMYCILSVYVMRMYCVYIAHCKFWAIQKFREQKKTLLRKRADRCECLLSNTSIYYKHWDVSRTSKSFVRNSSATHSKRQRNRNFIRVFFKKAMFVVRI